MINSNSYNTGLNQDTSKLKYPQTSYYSAENFKIVAQSGSSTYALENTKGTVVSFKLPDNIYNVFCVDPLSYPAGFKIQIDNLGVGEYPVDFPGPAVHISSEVADTLSSVPYIANQINLGNYTIQYNNKQFVIAGLNNSVSIQIYDYSTGLVTNYGKVYNNETSDVHVTIVKQITNPQIIGAINIINTLVLYSTEGIVESPTDTTGQIWKINYNEVTNSVSGLTGENLTPSVHLVYHQNMNLTNFHKISGEGRYETKDSQKTYFTDYYNSGRLFNIADPNSFAIPVEVIQNKPLHSTQTPVMQQIQDGGFIRAGRIQYFYQLLSNLGTQTTFSKASNLVSIVNSPLNSTYQNYNGSDAGTICGKAVRLKIDDLDTLYDQIKIGYILWEFPDLPTVRIFYEGAVPPVGFLETTHSGSEKETSLTISEFRNLQSAWDICKGFTQKKNILIAHNTKTIPFDVAIDCRAYRFSPLVLDNTTFGTARTAYLYDREDTPGFPRFTINGATKALNTGGDWEDIPQEADLINVFNHEEYTGSYNLNSFNWLLFSRYRFQSDGTTLGGEGPVIKYEFVMHNQYTDTMILHDTSGGGPFGAPLSGTTWNVSGVPPSNPYNSGANTYPIPSGLDCMKNPYLSSLFKGYARGEVYRWGIVFYDKKFQPSFVKWIGDIRFPDTMLDINFAELDYTAGPDPSSEELATNELGIQFTLDTSHPSFQAVKDQISGWSYVRVKRTDKDKTRLGTGILNSVEYNGTDDYFCNSQVDVNGGWGNSSPLGFGNSVIDVVTFENPTFKYNIGNQYVAGDWVKFLGRVERRMEDQWLPTFTRGIDSAVTKYYRPRWVFAPNNVKVQLLSNMYNAEVSTNKSAIQGDNVLPARFINMSNPDTPANPFDFKGWGGYTHLITSRGMPGNFFDDPNYFDPSTGPGKDARPYVSYERALANQYNGDQWERRMGQEYIGAEHFYEYTLNSPAQVVNEVFEGDVQISHFGFMKIDINQDAISGWTLWSPGYATIQFFPSEVGFDIELVQGIRAANKTGAAGEPNHDQFIYNQAYSQQDNSQLFYSKPFNFREVNENPYRMASAQRKIDGEFPDNWAKWLTNDFLDAEGTYGPINRMITQDDKVLFYQDYAVGVAAVEEQQVLNSDTTTNSAGLVLGEGTVLQRYDYITKNTGSKHQWAVVVSPKGAYHFDATLKKMFLLQVQGDKFGLTDIKGLNTTFQNFITQSVQTTDIPLPVNGLSIQGEWNPKHNEVYFTILDGDKTKIGDFRTNDVRRITISYNELTDSFDSFHTWYPVLYHRLENRLLTTASRTDSPVGLILPQNIASKTMFEHDRGEYNVYHKSSTAQTNCLFPSKLTIIISPQGSSQTGSLSHITKKLDVIEFITEVFDSNGIYIPLETINSIRVFNDYQDTGIIPLIYAPNPNYNIKKRFSSWRFNTLRDITDPKKPRLRDKTFTVEIVFNNATGLLNRRFIMNDIISQYEPDPFVEPV